MAMQRRCFVFLLGGAAVAALTGTSGCTASRIGEAVALSQRSEPLQQAPPGAVQRLLIVGDSTGVGTGASSAQGSLAGLIARDHPRLHIDNRSRDGATFADVVQQLEGEERHDVILVLAGGNDVTRMRALDAVRTDIDRVASMASARATYVVLMPAGNVGNARFFVPPVSWLMTSRSRTLHDLVRAAAKRHQVAYVNLFLEPETDPFVTDPHLTAADGLHPSDAGYLVWYRELLAQTDFANRLSISRDS
ncbi:MAG: GDSL family lipase [Gammaproteobacteria bacterium]|nr:GDSL family lipase [Gammaproteobacteria bacterium]